MDADIGLFRLKFRIVKSLPSKCITIAEWGAGVEFQSGLHIYNEQMWLPLEIYEKDMYRKSCHIHFRSDTYSH